MIAYRKFNTVFPSFLGNGTDWRALVFTFLETLRKIWWQILLILTFSLLGDVATPFSVIVTDLFDLFVSSLFNISSPVQKFAHFF